MVQPEIGAEELHPTTDRSSSSRMTMEFASAGKRDGLRTERRPIRRAAARSQKWEWVLQKIRSWYTTERQAIRRATPRFGGTLQKTG